MNERNNRTGKPIAALDCVPALRLSSRRSHSRSITIRMPVAEKDRLCRLAADKGIGYQTYMKILLGEALDREESSASGSRHATSISSPKPGFSED